MLTRQGWLLSGLAVATLVVGRILGTLELMLLDSGAKLDIVNVPKC